MAQMAQMAQMAGPRILVAAMALGVATCLTACGGSSSSGASAASKEDFCRTFDRLGSGNTPAHAADELRAVGTPDDIGTTAQHGFEVLIDHLRDLPAGTQPRQVTQMVQGLSAADAADVRAFITYYASECQDVPSGSSS